MAIELKTTSIQVADVDAKALQEQIETQLQGEGIRPAYLWAYGVKSCPMGLKFESEDLSLVKELAGKGYTFDEPGKFLCEVSSKIYGRSVTAVDRYSTKTLRLTLAEVTPESK